MKRKSGYYWVQECVDDDWIIAYFNCITRRWTHGQWEVFDDWWENIDETQINRLNGNT